MMQKHESMFDGHLRRNTEEKQKVVLNSPHAPPIRSAPYRESPKQQEFEREKDAQMEKAGATKLAVAKRASPKVFVPKKDKVRVFATNIADKMLLKYVLAT